MTVGIKIFLSIYENKIDDKKRTSVPSQFRGIIEDKGSSVVYAYPSLINQCIEVCTSERINDLEKYIDAFEIFSEEKDILATSILGACEPIQIDAKGRISLSDRLMEFAKIDKNVVFIGKGKVFEIWNKDDFDLHFQNARSALKMNKSLGNQLNNGASR